MRRLPTAIVSSVVTVISLGCDSSILCVPDRHVGEGEVPVVVGDRRGPLEVGDLDRDARERLLAEPLEHHAVEVDLRAGLDDLLDDREVVAVGDLHRRRLVVDLGRLEDELLGGGHGGGVEVGRGALDHLDLADLAVVADLDRQQDRAGDVRVVLVLGIDGRDELHQLGRLGDLRPRRRRRARDCSPPYRRRPPERPTGRSARLIR